MYLLRAQSKLETMAQRVGDAHLEQFLRKPVTPYEVIALSLGLAREENSDTLTIQRNDLEFSDFLVAADVFKNTSLVSRLIIVRFSVLILVAVTIAARA